MSRSPRFLGALGFIALAPSAPAQMLATESIDPATSSHVRVAAFGQPGQNVRAFVELNGVRAFLDLVPHSVRAETFRLLEQREDGSYVEIDPGPVTTYRGTVIGSPGAEVSAALAEDGLWARITLADGREQWVQPLTAEEQYVPGAAHIVYGTESVVVPEGRCGAEDLIGNVQKVVPERDTSGGPQTLAPQAVDIAQLAADADYEFYLRYGSTTAVSDRIQLVINSMNQQYERDVDITHEVGTILVRTSANQPYTSTDSGALLNQFRNHWENNQGSIVRDVAELFTGKNLNGSVIGIAWLGGICNSYGYNVVQSDFSSTMACSTDLSAHELGHNWNADHCGCPRKTMNPSITCENEFSQNKTVPDIVGFRNSLFCLQPGFITQSYFDDFETNTWTAGNWILGNMKPRLREKAAYNGLFGARLRNQTWIETTVDTTGISNVRLSYARRTKKLDAGEMLMSEWWDGGSWLILEQTSTLSWSPVTFNLGPSAGNNPALKIRFRTIASENRERGDVDDVKVDGF
jgi:hypothetical protein